MADRFEVYRTWFRFAYNSVRWRSRAAVGRDPVATSPLPEREKFVEGLESHDRWGSLAEQQAEEEQPSAYGWLDSPLVVEGYVWPRLFGDAPGIGWGEKAAHAFGLPRGSWLSLGCGSGNLEIQMAEAGLFDDMLAIDPSPKAIEVARQTAKERSLTNLTFEVGDANEARLLRSRYHVVHCNMSLHHIVNLEHAVSEINRSLVDGGVFVANEFVGPNQFQYPDERLHLVRDSLVELPESLRWDPVARQTKEVYPRFPRKHWNDWDPTESIRSDEIPVILRRNFPRLRRHNYGGSLLNLVLENIIQNFEASNPEHVEHLEKLVRKEWDLIERGVVESDFAYFVCPKGPVWARVRGGAAARLNLRRPITMSLRRRGFA